MLKSEGEYEGLVERLRAWGENSPDPDYFQGDVLCMVLAECTLAATALSALLEERERLEIELDAARLFGSGFFGESVKERTRDLYRKMARNERLSDSGEDA